MTREAPELRSSLDLPPPLSRQDAGFLQRRVAQVVTHRRLMLFEADTDDKSKEPFLSSVERCYLMTGGDGSAGLMSRSFFVC